MPKFARTELYDRFTTGNKPTEDDFADLIDSMINIEEDGIGVSQQGMPTEFVAQGTEKRFLDMSFESGSYIWRIKGRTLVDSAENFGFNITQNDIERLFIRQGNGHTGINTNNPEAQLHVKPGSEGALRIDGVGASNENALIVTNAGNVGIGTNSPGTSKLAVSGATDITGTLDVSGLLTATNGLTVSGNTLTASQGLTVNSGATLNGTVIAEDGLTVNTSQLVATSGAIVSGVELKAEDGLIVENGAEISGLLEANSGINTNGSNLTATGDVSLGHATTGDVTLQGPVIANSGITVSNGALQVASSLSVTGNATFSTGTVTVNDGLTVNSSKLEANGTVELGNSTDGDVTINGELITNENITSESGIITVKEKLSVLTDATLEAVGVVTLGNETNGIVTTDGQIQAKNGIQVQTGQLQALNGADISGTFTVNDGVTIDSGASIETGKLTAKAGLDVVDSELNASGNVVLGSESTNTVEVRGTLQTYNGATITGGALDASSGATIQGGLEVQTGETTMGTATVNTLNVTTLNMTGGLELDSVNFEQMSAFEASFKNITATGKIDLEGPCDITNNVVLGSGKIYATYEGASGASPVNEITKATGSSLEGGFEISHSGTTITIGSDDSSNVFNFLTDWNAYKRTNFDDLKDFDFRVIGSGQWYIKPLIVNLTSSGNDYKEYRDPANGLRILYTGSETTPTVEIAENSFDPSAVNFEFAVSGATLYINYPSGAAALRRVRNLIRDWMAWKNDYPESLQNFEIEQTGDSSWLIDDQTNLPLVQSQRCIREYLHAVNTDNLKIRHIGVDGTEPAFEILTGGTTSKVTFSTISNKLIVTLASGGNTTGEVVAGWNEWIAEGNDNNNFYLSLDSGAGDQALAAIADVTINSIAERFYDIETPNSSGLDRFIVNYLGNDSIAPTVTIASGSGFTFSLSGTYSENLTITYPATGTVDELLDAWDDFGGDEHFSLTKYDIGLYEVAAQSSDITDTPGNEYYKGIIRTNRVLLDGNIKFRDSAIEIDEISNDGTLNSNSESILPTQQAVRTYADAIYNSLNGAKANIAGDTGQAFSASTLTAATSLTVAGSTTIDGISNAALSDSSTSVPTENSVKAYVDDGLADKAELAGSTTQPFSASTLTAATSLTVAGSTTIDGISNAALSDSSTSVPTENSVKTYVDNELADKAELAGSTSQTFSASTLTAATSLTVAGTTIDGISDSALSNSSSSVPTENSVKTYVDTGLGNKADSSTLDTKADVGKLLDDQAIADSSTNSITYTLGTDSRGILMVHDTAGADPVTALFAVHGTAISLITGANFSHTQDNTGTCNVYYDGDSIEIQNNTGSPMTATVTLVGI